MLEFPEGRQQNAAEIYREELRDGYAILALETCMTEGALIRYQDTAYQCELLLWSSPGKEMRVLGKSGPIQEEQTTRTFLIPRQAQWMHDDDPNWICPEERKNHFPPHNRPSTNAIIHYQGFSWAVQEWEADAVEAAWTATATRYQPRRIEDE